MASRKGTGRSARTSSAQSKATGAPPPDKKSARSKRSRRSKRRPASIPSNWFTRADLPPRGGQLLLKLPTDYVVCMRGLAKLHGRTLLDTFKASLWSYLKLTRADQRRAMDLEPAMPAQETIGWSGVHADGRLLPWAAPSYQKALDVVNEESQVVRVVIRHLPSEPDMRPRGWKE